MKAISEMNNTELYVCTIKVSESRPRPDRSAGGGVFNTSGALSVKLFIVNLLFETKKILFARYLKLTVMCQIDVRPPIVSLGILVDFLLL